MQVVNITSPANYFHVLRRQTHRNFRKPLVVMAPKSLLRHKLAISKLAAMGPGTRFRRVLPETDRLALDKTIRRAVLCSGKIYFDLLQERRERAIKDVALIRVEQLYPWPRQTVMQQLQRYPKAEVVWCQEEAANMGGWTFASPRLDDIVDELGAKAGRPIYCGRAASASPATGLAKVHAAEQKTIVDRCLAAAAKDIPQPFRGGR